MKIITVNLPVSYLKMLDGLVGEQGLYPSRSELVRVAVRDFLIRELKTADSFTKFNSAPVLPPPPIIVDPIPAGLEKMVVVPGVGTFRLGRK